MDKYNDTESLLFLNRKEKFELGGEFFLAVETVRKINSADSAIGVNGDPQSLDIVATIGPTRKVW